MELFFASGVSLFFAFDSPEVRKEFHSVLRSLALPRLEPFLGETPSERWSRDGSESRWIRGELSNLEYCTAARSAPRRCWTSRTPRTTAGSTGPWAGRPRSASSPCRFPRSGRFI